MTRKSFTLMELLLVVVILGTLGGLALPRLLKFSEVQISDTAKTQLRVIKAATIIMIDSNIPFTCGPCDTDGAGANEINDILGIDVHDANFLYELTYDPNDPSAWTIDAIRQGGSRSYTLTLDSANPNTVSCSEGDCGFINM